VTELLDSSSTPVIADTPMFRSTTGQALTRFGIYKIVRRHAGRLDDTRAGRKVSPHLFRHYVDGRVMWPVEMTALAGTPCWPVPAT
jgi:integrase